MDYLNNKINEVFPGIVVRKDLVRLVKGNAIVPNYVLEFLLGSYCATSDEAGIQSGIETVKEILRQHYVHREEAEYVKSLIRERGQHKIIDKVSVTLDVKSDSYRASFSNLGVKDVLIDADTVTRHKKLLVGGVWCLADIAYEYIEDQRIIPWKLEGLTPIQMSGFNLSEFLEKRKEFTTDEWIDLILQSIGLEPKQFDRRRKFLQLLRLVPFCERNYNLLELGPKGTGKSHIYSEFSPHGILLSGGEVTVPKLFVNNATRQIGLVGYWDCIAFDEFSGQSKRHEKALVDILKNYMANKSFSRGNDPESAQASLAFVGNTRNELEHMLMHSNLFEELPSQFYDSAFMDRLHYFMPGWEVEIIRNEMFTSGYGFVVDYYAETLRGLREFDYTNQYQQYFYLPSEITTRDKDGINKTFSGLMKLIYPDGIASAEEMKELLFFAIEGRKRVKDQIIRLDPTFDSIEFGLHERSGGYYEVPTKEELEFPQHYNSSPIETLPIVETIQPEADRDILKEIARGENLTVEFKSTLSKSVYTKAQDKGVELSAMKSLAAFMNTDGGTLYIGVRDDGSIGGIEADGFENLDKFTLHFYNLLNKFMGKAVSKYLKTETATIEGKTIFIVHCTRSSEPVFFKKENKDGAAVEVFFVRVGPSSNELSMREYTAYARDRFATS